MSSWPRLGSAVSVSEKPAEDLRRLVRHLLDQSLWRVLIEAHLQQLQPVVVVIPEEPLQTRIEKTDGRATASGYHVGVGDRVEHDRRERICYVAEAALAFVAHEDLVLRRANHARRVNVEVTCAGRDLGLPARLTERARPDCVATRCREGERRLPVRPVLVEHVEHPTLGALIDEDLRADATILAPEVYVDDDLARPVRIGIL